MEIRKEKFSEDKIENLKKYWELYHSLGEPIDFEIIIDNFKAVRRTNNPDHFNHYKLSLGQGSKENTYPFIFRKN